MALGVLTVFDEPVIGLRLFLLLPGAFHTLCERDYLFSGDLLYKPYFMFVEIFAIAQAM